MLLPTRPQLLALSLAATATASQTPMVSLEAGAACACTKLASQFPPSSVLFSNSTGYTDETLAYWDRRAVLDPRCIFLPASAEQVATGMDMISSCGAQFAVRAGGHMNVSHLHSLTRLNEHLSRQGVTCADCAP